MAMLVHRCILSRILEPQSDANALKPGPPSLYIFSISLFPSFSILWLFAKRVELGLLSLPKLVTFQVPDQALCHPEGLYCTLDRATSP